MLNKFGPKTVLAAAILFTTTGIAAAYPDRPINLIVPFAPGGGTDLTARMIMPYVERELGDGARIIIINRPGAGGDIGINEVAMAQPDGYTLGLLSAPNVMMAPHERETRWNIDSFELIANMVFDPAVFAARANTSYVDVEDVILAARENDGRLTLASAGIGSNTHLDLLNFEAAAGVSFTHVPFDGGAGSRNALLGGHVELVASVLGDLQRYAEDGEVHIIGLMSAERSPLAPDVPTFAEQGYDIIGGSARGLIGPKDLPADVIETLASAIERALDDPDLIARMAEIAQPLQYMGTEEYRTYLLELDADLARIWQTTPWR